MRPMMIPLTTTLVISKPAPGQIYGGKQTVTMGVGGKTYKFVLNDAYVDDPTGIVHWPDIWELVRQYQPNFNVTGVGEDTFAKMQPGQTVTVRGMFSANNQTLEVMSAEPGAGPSVPHSTTRASDRCEHSRCGAQVVPTSAGSVPLKAQITGKAAKNR